MMDYGTAVCVLSQRTRVLRAYLRIRSFLTRVVEFMRGLNEKDCYENIEQLSQKITVAENTSTEEGLSVRRVIVFAGSELHWNI